MLHFPCPGTYRCHRCEPDQHSQACAREEWVQVRWRLFWPSLPLLSEQKHSSRHRFSMLHQRPDTRLRKPSRPFSHSSRKGEGVVDLTCLLTWLLSFPKKEVMVDAPHLQSPEYMGRHRSSCGHTIRARICGRSRSDVCGAQRGKEGKASNRSGSFMIIVLISALKSARHRVVGSSRRSGPPALMLAAVKQRFKLEW